ncbi:serine peptidase [Streptomyces sp. NPDC007991]|uniref:serine peptidase n=1 Tax=Streptomyces sp. NPDC007991 TaxID=3364803 RepID=UPI0036F0C79F
MNEIVIVHGVRNWQPGTDAAVAAQRLAAQWQPSLVAGYAAAGLRHLAVPDITVAYYAHHLNDEESQGVDEDIDRLAEGLQEAAYHWLVAAGLPSEPEEGQSWGRLPLRQALDLVARKRGVAPETLARVIVAFLPEVYRYLSAPARRARSRDAVANAIRESGAKVVIAHSLGSVVAYEALHANSDLKVETLITLGSPLGLAGAVFDALDPEPRNGRGVRPDVRRWTNIADAGDLVALPRRLGDRFPVDHHDEMHMALVDFHTLPMYLGCGLTAAAMAPFTA